MTTAKDGDSVLFHYTGTLNDGSTFDSSVGGDPMEIQIGAGQLIPGVEAELVGMAIGDTKKFTVASDDAYGPPRDELVQSLGRDMFPEDTKVEVGQMFEMTTKSGHPIPVVVTEVGDADVTVDANHPLAGRDLTFEIELVGIA